MKGKLLLTILISLFIGLFLSDLICNKFVKEVEEEKLLSFDLYKEYIDVVNSIIESYDPNMNYYGIYSKSKVNVYDLTTSEKAYIVYNYMIENGYMKDDFLSERDFVQVSEQFYRESLSLNSLKINDNLELIKNGKGYVLERKESYDPKITYFVINNGIKSAYQIEDKIYFDINVTFARKEINDLGIFNYSYSLSSKFDNILCEGTNCEREMKSVLYRITLKEKNDTYYFDNAVVLGSE